MIVILRLEGYSGDYYPPAEYCYVDMTPALAGALCDLIRLVAGLRGLACAGPSGEILSSLYCLESFANPAVPFNRLLPAAGGAADDEADDDDDDDDFYSRGIIDAEDASGTTHFPERGNGYLVCAAAVDAIRTDADKVRTGTDTVKATETAVCFDFSCRHSAGRAESVLLDYWQLAAWAGRLTLPRPWRALSAAEQRAIADANPVPALRLKMDS